MDVLSYPGGVGAQGGEEGGAVLFAGSLERQSVNCKKLLLYDVVYLFVFAKCYLRALMFDAIPDSL